MHVHAWSYTYVTYVLSLSDLFSVNILIILRYSEKEIEVMIIVDHSFVSLFRNHSAGHIGGMGGFRIGTSHKSTNATHKR